MKKNLLWIGDAACPSGFARATHETLDALKDAYDVTVVGINHRGDPHPYPYPIYAANASEFGDMFGYDRVIEMCYRCQPDVIVLQNDPWSIPPYLKQLARVEDYAKIPVIASVAVDGKNFQGGYLNGLSHVVFWTQFALDEARAGGYKGTASVIPLGVDLDTFYSTDKLQARLNRKLPREMDDAFIIGNVNRNQSRKRWDLTIKYFAEWITTYKVKDAYLYLHAAPTGDTGVNVEQLIRYYGIFDRVVLTQPAVWHGIPEHEMRDSYNCFDVAVSTTQGEGFGFTALEAMACGVPCVLPDWAAFGDWAKRGAWLVPCTSTAIGPPFVNVLGGIPDQTNFVRALHRLYVDKQAREQNAKAALECAQQPKFNWKNIGQSWLEMLEGVLSSASTKLVEVAS